MSLLLAKRSHTDNDIVRLCMWTLLTMLKNNATFVMSLPKDYSALETSLFELIPKILQNSLRAMSPEIALIWHTT